MNCQVSSLQLEQSIEIRPHSKPHLISFLRNWYPSPLAKHPTLKVLMPPSEKLWSSGTLAIVCTTKLGPSGPLVAVLTFADQTSSLQFSNAEGLDSATGL